MVFLLHFRSAFVALLTLPVGILMSFIVMRAIGVNANIMSLSGLAIAIGVMVDAAVVLVENLHKHKERTPDTPHLELVIGASKEVGPALFFSLLIVTVSFLPVFTLQQQEGRLFPPLAYTKTFAMASAALLAITIIPVLMYYFVRGKLPEEANNPISRFFIWIYRPVIRLVLQRPEAHLVAALVVLVVSSGPGPGSAASSCRRSTRATCSTCRRPRPGSRSPRPRSCCSRPTRSSPPTRRSSTSWARSAGRTPPPIRRRCR